MGIPLRSVPAGELGHYTEQPPHLVIRLVMRLVNGPILERGAASR
jgi:hypothetical protein